jgi:hypothetical protein
MSTRLYCTAAIFLSLGLSQPGCGEGGDALPREPVTGRVTLDGQPLDGGSISFSPADPGQANSVSVGARIAAGSYSMRRADGPTPGKYRVAILGDEEATAPPTDEAPGPMPKRSARQPVKESKVPGKYNTKSTLTADVKAGESNTFDFDLKTR